MLHVEDGGKLGIGADAVVVAVSADEAAVKAEVAGVHGRDGLQLGGDKVLLDDAVLLVQQLQNGEADAVGAVVIALRPAADQNVEAFGRNGLERGAFCPALGQGAEADR